MPVAAVGFELELVKPEFALIAVEFELVAVMAVLPAGIPHAHKPKDPIERISKYFAFITVSSKLTQIGTATETVEQSLCLFEVGEFLDELFLSEARKTDGEFYVIAASLTL